MIRQWCYRLPYFALLFLPVSCSTLPGEISPSYKPRIEALVKQLTEEPYSIHIVEDHYTIASIDLRTQWIIFNAKMAKKLIEKKPNWLRAILAHEIAHVELGHLYAMVGDQQELEFEADQEAVNILINRGHDPWDYWRYMKAVKNAVDKNPRGFYEQEYSSHPYVGERLEKIEKLITELKSSRPEQLADRSSVESKDYSEVTKIAPPIIAVSTTPKQIEPTEADKPIEVNPGVTRRASPKTSESETPRVAQPLQANKPVWKVGYKWVYEWERPGSSGTLTREIIREESFDGVPCFVLKGRRQEVFYTKDVLGLFATKRRGEVTRKRDVPFQVLAWPLKVGRQWNNIYTSYKPQEGASWNYDNKVVVTKLEEVTVPAGTFKAFKIDVYRSFDRELKYEYWYSPKVKWFVKKISYLGRGTRPREEKLKSYTIN